MSLYNVNSSQTLNVSYKCSGWHFGLWNILHGADYDLLFNHFISFIVQLVTSWTF